ncbi:MAG: 3-isopropylmalate dehydratase small subunit [Ignavibacteria bacterium GWA2_55_11]|nr:MAG: 3-isopropylmalate dehydratase small subunit [Ignavibacteria bacterium GWA2_55_11]OGU65916.1 MAG: 3-isopropylmalate dehydratase small subunit [Ignavibacteria bacterium RIFCSPHIGHO2_02_FULL_56_12]OGU69595.1 MAG: 3-isopropylmalate dehydratase small subunit [Ignavibacteria bacterium RIFCSPLOWO2_02_FULL_55_14]OGU75784.1 MAG: 3-isopropylmalate dehydratase small subunit [Ignavibacteria bacterium RIFCSPLOWO2_12_FULL_56_21]
MSSFPPFSSRIVYLPHSDIDTDQIIPARYLKVTDKQGLGEGLFADLRRKPDGSPDPDFPLNKPENSGASVLLTGENFGCGSSREHAPWALKTAGFRAIISASFADIFRNNALKNSLLPVVVDAETHARLVNLLALHPEAEVAVDLASQTVRLPDGFEVRFPLDGFSKRSLLDGVDELGYILSFAKEIENFERRHESPPGEVAA